MKRTIKRTEITVESIEITTIRRSRSDPAPEPQRRDWVTGLRQLISGEARRTNAEFEIDEKGEKK